MRYGRRDVHRSGLAFSSVREFSRDQPNDRGRITCAYYKHRSIQMFPRKHFPLLFAAVISCMVSFLKLKEECSFSDYPISFRYIRKQTDALGRYNDNVIDVWFNAHSPRDSYPREYEHSYHVSRRIPALHEIPMK